MSFKTGMHSAIYTPNSIKLGMIKIQLDSIFWNSLIYFDFHSKPEAWQEKNFSASCLTKHPIHFDWICHAEGTQLSDEPHTYFLLRWFCVILLCFVLFCLGLFFFLIYKYLHLTFVHQCSTFSHARQTDGQLDRQTAASWPDKRSWLHRSMCYSYR